MLAKHRLEAAPSYLPGAPQLIEALEKLVHDYAIIDNRTLFGLADTAFGGSMSQGVYDPRDAYDAMEVAVHRWLSSDLAPKLMKMGLTDALQTHLRPLLTRLPRQNERTNESTLLQQFSTPPTIAFMAARLLNPTATDIVLEPSAGTGALAMWARAVGAQVICNEIAPRRRQILQDLLSYTCFDVDGEIIHDILPDNVQPSLILMNPPFSSTGGRVNSNDSVYGSAHIESALLRLRPGGRLVAIASSGISFARSRFTAWWQKLAQRYNIRANLTIAGHEYSKYGTYYDIQIIRIDKTGRTPGTNWNQQIKNIKWGEAPSLEEAWAVLSPLVEAGSIEVRTEDRASDSNSSLLLFTPYQTAKLTGGADHPGPIVEATSMAAVQPPDITYTPKLPVHTMMGPLSRIQLERVIYAGQRHEQRLKEGCRAGMYIGDGTGVGKGRSIAAIIADNWIQGRRRAVWFSVNQDLIEASKIDIDDLELPFEIPIAKINSYGPTEEIAMPEGVIFCTYPSLIAEAQTGERRFDQLTKWLGNEGILIFDEAHRAKNALVAGRGEPTQTGKAVIDIQDPVRFPDYRIVYASATGATDVRNMAYMTRLGLWGDGTAFPNGFNEFLVEIEGGGVGAMEMVSRDMKSGGMYLSGSISYGLDPASGKAVEYGEYVHKLTDQQREMYDAAAGAWQVVLQSIDEALDVTNSGKRQSANAKAKFWGDHQRFFRQLICAFKIPTLIAGVEEALANNHSAIISLIGTAESRTREQVVKTLSAGGTLEDLDFSPREILGNMIERGFPTLLFQDETDEASGKIIQVVVRDKPGKEVHSKEALAIKEALLDSLSMLTLPENPLDQLINYFGPDHVAEITGRTRRLIRDTGGHVEYVKRVPDGVPMHRANLYEMHKFQDGEKRIAIISNAGSLGISLHSSLKAKNKQRRVHITLELGWSADIQLQSFGRSHRTNQAVPPIYNLLSTELAGEKRFSSTIAKRLNSLGALTKGDRGAADASDLSRRNYETYEGQAALSLMFRRIMESHVVPGIDNPHGILRDIGLMKLNADGVEYIAKSDMTNVPRFLNRILALTVDLQNALFDYFDNIFDQTIRYAKANGTFDAGVTDVQALNIRVAQPPRVVYEDKITGALTRHYALEIEVETEGISFTEAQNVADSKFGKYFQHIKSCNCLLAVQSGRHTNSENGETYLTYACWKPEGARIEYISDADLKAKYQMCEPAAVVQWWNDRFDKIPKTKKDSLHIISGTIIALWHRLKTDKEAKLRVVRVTAEDGRRIVGVQIPPGKVGTVLRELGVTRALREPSDIFRALMQEGEVINIARQMTLRPSVLRGHLAIELVNAQTYQFREMRSMGLINISHDYKQRFYIPADELKGVQVLTMLLAQYPILSTGETEGDLEIVSEEQQVLGVQESQIVDLRSWMPQPVIAIECPPIIAPMAPIVIVNRRKSKVHVDQMTFSFK